MAAGLQLETECSSQLQPSASQGSLGTTHFVKIHAPVDIINLNAEIAGLKPTVREYGVTYYNGSATGLQGLYSTKGDNSRGGRGVDAGGGRRCQALVRSVWKRMSLQCDTIPPEPSIFSPGITLDNIDRYWSNCLLLKFDIQNI